MNSTLRFATADDMPQILAMVKELASFEKASHEVTVTVDDFITDSFEHNLFKTIVAEVNREIVGIALYYPRYSTWKGRTIHLEDFIVKEKFRGSGIGRKLFDAVVNEANKFNAKRLEWCVLDWNEPARKFYKKLGAELDSEWELGKLRENQIKNFNYQYPELAGASL